ncbi:hypothetical protein [Anatilimnocola floriformis]|uniref:hypothetical protein n=1 Tax=Anatilimnocola floriformis TaxID=2948575 RepID=UPI0020C30E73|nr:hypothetical protein [Anatilimnocola floriformis]
MKFTLRDLFWLVLVCAVTLGWWIDRAQLSSDATKYRDLGKASRDLADHFARLKATGQNQK